RRERTARASIDRDADPLPAVPHAQRSVRFIQPAGTDHWFGRSLSRIAGADVLLTIPPVPAQLILRERECVLPVHGPPSFRPFDVALSRVALGVTHRFAARGAVSCTGKHTDGVMWPPPADGTIRL